MLNYDPNSLKMAKLASEARSRWGQGAAVALAGWGGVGRGWAGRRQLGLGRSGGRE
jgi:hypothetical protein